jgi:hypothetical protein
MAATSTVHAVAAFSTMSDGEISALWLACKPPPVASKKS